MPEHLPEGERQDDGLGPLFRLLLKLLPEEGREAFGAPLAATLADTLRAARRKGRLPGAACRVREWWALLGLLIREHREAARERASGEGWTTMLTQDIRFAFRGIRRNPGTAAVSVLTLALGIGAVTAIASVIDGVLVRNLAYADADRVLYLGETTPDGGYTSTSYENFRDTERAGIFAALGVTIGNSVAVIGDGQPERIRGEFVSASYFDVIGVAPALGRPIAPGEDEPGGPRTAVISHGWWEGRYGGDPSVLGRTVMLNNEPHTIVGVMPAGFRSPWDTPQAWISLHTAPRSFDRSSRGFQAMMARMQPDQTVEGAEAEFEAFFAGLVAQYPDANVGRGTWVFPLADFLAERNRPFLAGLGAAVLLLLFIACANVASLQLARAAARRREMAVRTALGGGRRRLARLVLIENGVVFALGGAAGVGVAWLGVAGLVALQPAYASFYDVRLSVMTGALGLALAAVTGLVFGLVPALEVSRSAPSSALREGGRGGGAGRGARRFRSGLVVGQLALSTSLLIGACLLARTMSALMGVDPGFDAERLLTLEFRLPQNRYEDDADRLLFYDDLLTQLQALPGVQHVGFASDLPFSGNGGSMRIIPEGSALEWDDAPIVRSNTVSPGYRETMGVELLEGRDLEEADGPDVPFVVLVSRSAAERHFGGGEVVGRVVYASPDRSIAGTVVGIVDDVRTTLTDPPEPYVWVSYRQSPSLFMSVAIRTAGEPMALASAVRETVWRVDPDQPVWEVMPITERMAGHASDERFNAVLVVVFAAIALLLASLGLYGVMAYSVRQRERELGVRLALGASPRSVMGAVLRRGAALVALGLLAGQVVGWWLASLLESTLFGVRAGDPLAFGAAVCVLGVVGLFSTWLPARRVMGLDPVRTLGDA